MPEEIIGRCPECPALIRDTDEVVPYIYVCPDCGATLEKSMLKEVFDPRD